MNDLISRSKIYDYVKTIINPYGKPFKGTVYELGLKIMDYIKNMSSVELPVRGEWINTDGYDEWECSECGYQDCGYDEYPTNGKSGLNFCPNCGAGKDGVKMFDFIGRFVCIIALLLVLVAVVSWER